jgi:hypothetical protein
VGLAAVSDVSAACLLCGKGDTSTHANAHVHSLSCSSLQHLLTRRHHLVKRAISASLHALESRADAARVTVSDETRLDTAGFTPQDHAAAAINNRTATAKGLATTADIVVAIDAGASRHVKVLDVTITGPSTSSAPNVPYERAGQAAARASAEKVKKYQASWKFNAGDVIPIAFDTSGYLHDGDFSLLRALVHKILPKDPPGTRIPLFAKHFNYLLSNASIALQQGNAAILRAYRSEWRRRRLAGAGPAGA